MTKKGNTKQSGFSLVELMVAVSVLGILSLGVVNGFGTAARIIRGSDRSSVQSQLALEKLEQLAATKATDLAAGQTIETNLKVRGISFKRTTVITAFNDGSRQVAVQVDVTTPGIQQPAVSYSSKFNPWGLR